MQCICDTVWQCDLDQWFTFESTVLILYCISSSSESMWWKHDTRVETLSGDNDTRWSRGRCHINYLPSVSVQEALGHQSVGVEFKRETECNVSVMSNVPCFPARWGRIWQTGRATKLKRTRLLARRKKLITYRLILTDCRSSVTVTLQNTVCVLDI